MKVDKTGLSQVLSSALALFDSGRDRRGGPALEKNNKKTGSETRSLFVDYLFFPHIVKQGSMSRAKMR